MTNAQEATPRFICLTFEAVFQVGPDTGSEISSALEDLRGSGAARAVASRFLMTDEDYDQWYKGHGIREVEIPVPQIVRFD